MIKCITFNSYSIISKIEEISSELGEPDCKLTDPFLIGNDNTLSPWLGNITNETNFMISSDKIITISEPKKELLEKYERLIK